MCCKTHRGFIGLCFANGWCKWCKPRREQPTRRTEVKRRGIWAACVALLVGVGVLVVGTGFVAKNEDAKDEDADEAKCSVATLHGRYLYAYDGVEGKKQTPFAVAGHQVFNGNGTQHGVSSFNVNGKTFSNQHFSGTYTVKADCTGTITTDGSESDMFIAPDGSMFTWVQTKPRKVVTSGFELRGTAKRVAQ
jgi:hypothetical protein